MTATRELTDILTNQARTTALLTRYENYLDDNKSTEEVTLEGARIFWTQTYLTNFLAIQEEIKNQAAK